MNPAIGAKAASGPGGRGLLDARLRARRRPGRRGSIAGTWPSSRITRWRTSSSFRRRRLWRWCWKPGVQLFEGRPFVVEDFEIRKPLILPEPASGVQLELSYEPAERTFAIQSKFEQGAAWSLHVVGSMRGERTESAFAASTWERKRAAGRRSRSRSKDFYRHMSDLGLRYGEEFRPIRELAAGAGHSAGRVALSETIARRAANMRCTRCCSMARCRSFPRARRRWRIARPRMKLPVRFARILFLRVAGRVELRARVRCCSATTNSWKAASACTMKRAQPCVLVDGFRAISVAGCAALGRAGRHAQCALSRRLGSARRCRRARAARRAAAVGAAARGRAQRRWSRSSPLRGRAALMAAMAAGDELAAAQLARGLREMARVPKRAAAFTAESPCGSRSRCEPAFERLMANLAKRGLLEEDRRRLSSRRPPSRRRRIPPQAMLRAFIVEHPGHLAGRPALRGELRGTRADPAW